MDQHVDASPCPFCHPPKQWEHGWTCTWCGQGIQPRTPWLLRSVPGKEPEPYHHDCYIYGVIPGEQEQLKRRHSERMAALQERR